MKHSTHFSNQMSDPYTIGIEQELGLRQEEPVNDFFTNIENKNQKKQKNEYSDDLGQAWLKMMQKPNTEH